MTRNTLRKLNLLFIALLSVCLAQWYVPETARSADSPWSTPLNLSVSGAASQPAVTSGPDGTLHVLWWDSVSGEQYLRIGVTDTQRSQLVVIPEVFGDRTVTLDTRTQQSSVAQTPPREVRLLTDAQGALYVFWYDVNSRLLMDQISGGHRVTQTISTDSVVSFDVTRNGESGLQIAYIKSKEDQGTPAGVYYRSWTGGQWSAPKPVSTSSYFRALKTNASTISVASNGNGVVILAWDDPYLGRSLYAHSEDGGTTWSKPESISSADSGIQAHVAYTPNTEFMLIWRDPVAGACVLMQRRSNDGMKSWSAPQRILNSMTRCPERWSFNKADNNQMWLLGMPAAVSAEAAVQTNQGVNDQAVMALWNNDTWSAQGALNLSFYDASISRTLSLGCINVTLSGQMVGMVGCDSKGDVWMVRSKVNPEALVSALARPWSAVNVLSQAALGSINEGSLGEVQGYPALTSDVHGRMYALWSQPVLAGTPKISLFTSVWESGSWSQAVQVLDSPSAEQNSSNSEYASRAEQASLTTDSSDRLHAVWVSGPGGLLYYSKVQEKDVLSTQDWAKPIALKIPTQIASWPKIIADARSNSLYIIYAVPYNEQRGVYLIQSSDGGSTWSEPVRLFDGAAAGWLSADKPQLALDATAGILHAVWLRSELPGGADSPAIFYARSVDSGKTWSTPVQLAVGNVDWPRVTVPVANQVLVAWNETRTSDKAQAAAPMSIWERTSIDGGMQWVDASRVPGFEQVSGPIEVASDQTGALFFAGVGMTSDGESNLLYAQKKGDKWGDQDAFGLGQKATLSNAAAAALVPTAGQLGVLMRGWVWQADGSGQFGVLAATRGVSVTQVITPVATFTPVPAPTATVTPESLPSPTSTQVQLAAGTAQMSQGGSSSGQSALVIAGILAAVIVIGGITLRSVIRARHG